MTTITGYLYNALGQPITSGILSLTLQQDMVFGGVKIAPLTVSVNLANQSPAGFVSVSLYPTVGATPAGLTYLVEFDPTPSDTSRPMRTKDGYWSNYWAVPDTASPVPLGNFADALRGTAAANYLPLTGSVNRLSGTTAGSAGALVTYLVVDINGVQRKIAIYAM
jgi:hypothetical protein